MNKKIIQRLPQCFFGLFLCGFGLAFTIEAKLGLNPWDVFHDGFSRMAELADALDSKSSIFGCGGSTPPPGTF